MWCGELRHGVVNSGAVLGAEVWCGIVLCGELSCDVMW